MIRRLAFVIVLAACGGKSNSTIDAPPGGGDGSDIDAPLVSNPDGGGPGPTSCVAAGGACAIGTDCCTNHCDSGTCSTTQCTADGATCASNAECCGGTCNGTCTPLNAACKTSGNTCAANTDCCSGDCNANHLCAQPSFCVQNGDACGHDDDCCGGICKLGNNGVGTCTQPTVGATNCSAGIDGSLCEGCGDCCSRLCAPYGATGVKICQPAEGCRVDGDLCAQDSDCCGGDPNSGLPGAGNVQCLKQHTGDKVGICRNPMSCDPEGDVCHYKDYQTCGNSSARNDCCGAPGNSGVCQLDALGVPRCYGLGTACKQVGNTCAFSGDCCDGMPCVPDATGALHCGATACQQAGNSCTSTADCCNGSTCNFPPGSTQGTCGTVTTTCAQYGQACSTTNACCDGTPCNGPSNAACTAGETDCTCFQIIF